jgi:alcohol dehydrogenase
VKAWRLTTATRALSLEDIPEPAPCPGSVVVRIEAAGVVSYLRRYMAGALPSYNPPPGAFTPGTSAIGVIEQVGRDVYQLHPGQRVLLTGNYTVPENVPEPARALLGITAPPAFVPVLETWPDGTFAERALVPLSTATPIPPALDGVPSAVLAAATRCLVPYGGFLRGRLLAGETVVVNGATGGFGSAGVHVALAMGAGTVVAAGRNASVLTRFAELDRVRAVRLSGDVEADSTALRDAAGGHVDLALDLVGAADSAASTLATLDSLGRNGRLVLMGSMTTPLPIDATMLMATGREIIGNFMYPADAPARLLALVAGGLLDLTAIPTVHRPLAELERAMDEAAAPNAPLVVVGG